MDSLNCLKDNYRTRYCSANGQGQAIDIQQGQNVLKYIQDCFETCTNEFTVCSPSASCSSSPYSVHTQVSTKSKVTSPDEEGKKLNLDKISCVKSAFNTLANSSDLNDSSDEDASVSLGSPALLLEEETKSPGHMQVIPPDQNTKIQEKKSEILESLTTMRRSSTKGCDGKLQLTSWKSPFPEPTNTINVGLEKECEFLIVESFGASSTSWISGPQKNKAKKKDLKTVSSETKKATKLQRTKKKDKRASDKLVSPQTKMKLDVSRGTFDELTDVAKISGRTSVVNDHSQMVVHLVEHSREHTCSKEKQLIESGKEDAQDTISMDLDEPALLEEDDNFSVESRVTIPTNQQSSFGKPVKQIRSPRISQSEKQSKMQRSKHKCSEEKQLIHPDNEDDQETMMGSEAQPGLPEQDNTFSVESKTIIPTNQQSFFDKPFKKRRSPRISQSENQSEMQRSKHKCSEEKQLMHQDDQETMMGSEAQSGLPEQDNTFSVESKTITPTNQQSSVDKPLKKRRSPRISQSKKQLRMQSSNVKRSVRRKKVPEENSESEHVDKCGKQTENPHEQRLTDLRKMSSLTGQKANQTFSVSSEDHDGDITHRQDSCTQYVEKALITSMEKHNIRADSLQFSCATDESRYSSGPVWDDKYEKKSKCENSFNTEDSTSNGSVDLEENSEEFNTQSLKSKMVMPTNTPNVRRTKRIRLKPLEYWRGERVNYRSRPSGGLIIGGIISPEVKQPRKYKKTIKPVMESENILADDMVFVKDPSQPAAVFDPVSNQEVMLECVSSGKSHLLFIDNEALSIYKYLTTPSFSVGKIILKPLKEKGLQYSHLDTLVFHIIHGKLLLTLYGQGYRLAAGDCFYIPAGNIYNIQNLLNTDCVIFFTQLKGNRLEEK